MWKQGFILDFEFVGGGELYKVLSTGVREHALQKNWDFRSSEIVSDAMWEVAS